MTRRADSPQTTNTDTPRTAELRRAARECMTTGHPNHLTGCPLNTTLPDTLGPHDTTETLHAVVTITGKGIDAITPAYLRAQLRRWAIRNP